MYTSHTYLFNHRAFIFNTDVYFIVILISAEATGGLPLRSNTRPDWALFGKVNENMETVLFREKFLDWPDQSRLIKVKGQDDEKDQKVHELKMSKS